MKLPYPEQRVKYALSVPIQKILNISSLVGKKHADIEKPVFSNRKEKIFGFNWAITKLSLLSVLAITILLPINTKAQFSVSDISLLSSTQTGTAVYGTSATVSYSSTLTLAGSGSTNKTFELDWIGNPTPSGVSLSPTTVSLTSSSQDVTFNLTTSNTTEAGSYTFKIKCVEDNKFSGNATLVITPASITITANSSSKTYGQTITPVGNEFTPSGLQNGETIGSVTLTSTGFTAGALVSGSPYSIVPSAATGGSFNPANYNITYAAGSLTLSKANSTVSVLSDASSVCQGTAVTFTASISSSATPVTGTVSFYDNGVLMGSSPVNVSTNSATYTTNTLTPGSHAITAAYSGDANFNSSGTASSYTQAVVAATTVANAGPDQTGNSTCGLTSVTLGGNSPSSGNGNWSIISGTGGSITNASSADASFSGTAGNTYTLRWTITNAPCSFSSDDVNIIFNLKPSIQNKTATLCSNGSFTITPTTLGADFVPSGTTYSWPVPSVTGAITGGSSSSFSVNIGGTLVNPTNTAQTATYTVTPTSGICVGMPFDVVATVNPKPTIANENVSVCNATNFSVTPTHGSNGNVIPSGTTYSWPVPTVTGSLAGGSLGNNQTSISGNLNNSTVVPQTATYAVTPVAGICTGSAFNVTVAVQPKPVLSSSTTLSDICSGSTLNYSASSASTVSFSWSRPAVSGINGGASSSGTGASINETLTSSNSTNTVVVYAVTMTINGCSNTQNVSVTVKPTPDVIMPPVVAGNPYDQTICSGSSITAISFSGNVAGTTYNWSRENISGIIGSGNLSAYSGTGSITGGFTSTNSAPSSVNFSVTPVANGCTGSPVNNIAMVTINPVPTLSISNPSTQTVCSGNGTTAVNFSGVATSYNWNHNQTGAIGITTSGAGNISSFATSNSGTSPVNAVFTVSPLYTNNVSCFGASQNFTVTINPRPILTSTLNPAAICSGNSFSYTPTTSATGVTTTFNWTRAVVTGISNAASSGTGNPNEVLINTTGAPVVVTYVYTLSAINATDNNVSCSSTSTYNVQVTVKPTPEILATPSANQSFCTGSSTTAITLSNPNSLSGTTYAWTRNNTTSITGTSSGSTNSIGSMVFINTTSTPQTTIITATATYNACSTSTSINIQVNPPIANNTVSDSQISETELCGQPKSVTINSPEPTSGDGTYTYQWYYSSPGNSSWVPIPAPSGTTQFLTYQVSDNAFFYRVVSSGGCTSSSGLAHVNKPTSAGSGLVTGGGTYCLGGSGVTIVLNGSVVGADYQLQLYSGATWVNVSSPGIQSGNGSSLSFTGVIPSTTTPGTYTYRIVGRVYIKDKFNNISLCEQVMPGTVTVTINPLPSAPNGVNGSPTTICAGQSANIFGTTTGSPVNINWYNSSSGGTAINGTSIASGSNYAVSPSANTTYYAESINTTTGCVSAARVPVTITVNPRPVITSASSAPVCSGSTLAIALTNDLAISGSTYAWVATDNVNVTGESLTIQNAATINNILLNSTSTTQTVNYAVTVTTPVGSGGCTSPVQSLVVTVNPTPSITQPQTQTICSGTAFSITPANGSGNIVPASTSYTWADPSGSGFTGGSAQSSAQTSIGQSLTNTTDAQTTATYQVTPVSGTCTGAVFNVTVPINPRPNVPLTQTLATCSGSGFSFTPANGVSGNIVPAGTTYSWAAPTGSGINGVASGSNQSAVTGSLTNTSSAPQTARIASYSVTANAGSCSTTFPLNVTVNPLPVATIAGTTSICQNGTTPLVTFTGTTGTSPFTFTYSINGVGSNTITTSSGNSVTLPVSTATSGTYSYGLINVTDNAATGCTQAQSGTATVQINPEPTLATVSTTAVCSGTNATITLSGLVAGASTTINYSVGGIAKTPISITASGTGTASFNYPVVDADNGKSLVVTSLSLSPGACSKSFSNNTTLVINPRFQAAISGSDLACVGSSSPLSITITGIGSYAGTLNDGTTFSGNATSSPTTITVNVIPLTTTTYSITSLTNTGTGCNSNAGELTGSATLTIPVGTSGQWTGAISTDWFDCRNWANGVVPTASTNVVIPTGVPRAVVIDPSTSLAMGYGGVAVAQNITINGSSLSFTIGGKLQVNGNWQNNVGAVGFSAGTGSVEFTGSTAQTINTVGVSENFYNLSMNKPSGANTAATGVTLNNAVTVGGSLDLNANGLINTSASAMLSITNCNANAISGGSANSYVNGIMNRCTNSTGNYVFPIGNAAAALNVYRPAIIAPVNNAMNSFNAAYQPTAATNPLDLRMITGILQTEYWQIDKVSGSSDAIVKLNYINPNAVSGWEGNLAPCADCNVAIAKSFNTSPGNNPWYFTNYPSLGSGFSSSLPEYRSWLDNGLIWSKPLSTFGQFTFGFSYNQVLPVKLISFTGNKQAASASLNWKIEASPELDYFELEYSTNGNAFTKLSKISGSSSYQYSFVHSTPASGPNYYRLIIHEKTGLTSISPTVLIDFNAAIKTTIDALKQNPVKSDAIVPIFAAKAQQVNWRVISSNGLIIQSGKKFVTAGNNQVHIDFKNLSQGYYFLNLFTEDGTKAVLPLLKE